jgi:hypothetical protein
MTKNNSIIMFLKDAGVSYKLARRVPVQWTD